MSSRIRGEQNQGECSVEGAFGLGKDHVWESPRVGSLCGGVVDPKISKY